MVIDDEGSWSAFWVLHSPGTAVPSIDFRQDSVVLAFTGERQSTGFTIEIDRVARIAGELVVDATIRSPGSECVTGDAITRPFDIVTIPALTDDLSVRLDVRDEIDPCGDE